MISFDLNHSYTPTELRDLNEKIAAQLADDSATDFSLLNRLIEERDTFIKAHLDELGDSQKQAFAKQELDVNNRLTELAQVVLGEAKDDITNLVRSRSAIKKYK